MELCSRPSLLPNEFKRFQKLILSKKVNINCVNAEGETPLLLLCRLNSSDNLNVYLKTLFKRFNIQINYRNREGWSALIAVCFSYRNKNLIKVVNLLLKQGIDHNTLTKHGWNALHALLCGANLGECNVTDVVRSLLSAGIDINKGINDMNALMLWSSCNHGHPEFIPVIRLLLEGGINLNSKNQQGQNALLIICKLYNGSGLLEIVHLLIEKGIQADVRDKEDRNALEIVSNRVLSHHPNIIQLLRSAMAKNN